MRGVVLHDAAKLLLSTAGERVRLRGRRARRRDVLREATYLVIMLAPLQARHAMRGHARVTAILVEILSMHF